MSQKCSHNAVVYVIVGTLSFVSVLNVSTLATCAVLGIIPDKDTMLQLKDIGLVALGSLGTLLAQTRSANTPQSVEVTNTPANPVPTTDEKPNP